MDFTCHSGFSDLPMALVSHVSAFSMVKCRAAWRRRRRRVHFQSCFWLLEEQWLRKRSLLSRASLMMVCQASSNPLDSGSAFVTILHPGKLSFKEYLRDIDVTYRKSLHLIEISWGLELNKVQKCCQAILFWWLLKKQNWNFMDARLFWCIFPWELLINY